MSRTVRRTTNIETTREVVGSLYGDMIVVIENPPKRKLSIVNQGDQYLVLFSL